MVMYDMISWFVLFYMQCTESCYVDADCCSYEILSYSTFTIMNVTSLLFSLFC